MVHRADLARRPGGEYAADVGDGPDAEARFPGAGAALLVHPGAAVDRRWRRMVPGIDDGCRRCDRVRPACAGVCGARLRRRLFSPARAAISALAAGCAGCGAAVAQFGAGAGGANRRRRAAAALDLRRRLADRRAALAAGDGVAAMAAAPATLALGALARLDHATPVQPTRQSRLLAARAQGSRARKPALPP